MLAMTAFAANSLLCRLALKGAHIDAIAFGSIRVASGAAALWLLLQLLPGSKKPAYSWRNAALLSVYVFAFSLAYVSLNTATGALLLFGAVQLVMTGWGLISGEKLTAWKTLGILGALGGIGLLLLPGVERPPVFASLMMMLAGAAWGLYSIAGKRVADAAASVTGNFILSVPIAVIAALAGRHGLHVDATGVMLGVISGAITSGAAYLLWYALLPSLHSTTASTLQLSVPCLAALGGVVFIGEPLTLRVVVSTVIILAGIGLVIWSDKTRQR